MVGALWRHQTTPSQSHIRHVVCCGARYRRAGRWSSFAAHLACGMEELETQRAVKQILYAVLARHARTRVTTSEAVPFLHSVDPLIVL
jgi:hypothetical protein